MDALTLMESDLIPTDELLSMFAGNYNDPFIFGASPSSNGSMETQTIKMGTKKLVKKGAKDKDRSEEGVKIGMKRIIKQDFLALTGPKKQKLEVEALPGVDPNPTEKTAAADVGQPRRQT